MVINTYWYKHPNNTCACFLTVVTGEANFSMESTCLTVGGFSQPSVTRSCIEQSGSAEIGLSQRFLWLPSYCRFNTLEGVDRQFSDSLGKTIYMYYVKGHN